MRLRLWGDLGGSRVSDLKFQFLLVRRGQFCFAWRRWDVRLLIERARIAVVIVCGLVVGGIGKADLKELKARLSGGSGGIVSFRTQFLATRCQLPDLISWIEPYSALAGGPVKGDTA
jgi:hypothetical protein